MRQSFEKTSNAVPHSINSSFGKPTDWTKLALGMGPIRPALGFSPFKEIRSLSPWGFRELGLGLAPVREGAGPGPPPVGFVGGTNSATEWMVYWAFTKLIGPEGVDWTYQESFAGGRHIPGGAVADFVLYMPRQEIIVRVQTWRFHFALGSDKIETDIDQKINLTIFGEVITIDVYEQTFINDPSGAAVLAVCADAMKGIEWPNPLATGMAADV